MEKKDNSPIMVVIRCIAYNHEKYIRQTLDGFVMQKTNFRFVAVVHDDASTDGTADIIREYAQKYPDIILPILETENQYSKHDGSLRRIIKEATRKANAKYSAGCEGDDYWIDPLKLQKQVDYMEAHPECSMTCTAAKQYSQSRQMYVSDVRCADKDCVLRPEDIIMEGGAFIATCSIVTRTELLFSNAYHRDYIQKCMVGDYPLQIFCAMQGDVYYFNEPMSVYRIDNSQSWVGRMQSASVQQKEKYLHSECNMHVGFAKDYPKYKRVFYKTISIYTTFHYTRAKSKEEMEFLDKVFADCWQYVLPVYKVNLFLKRHPMLSGIRNWVTSRFGEKLLKLVKRN